ncbi:MAG: TonB-dependent receptor [Bacteroidota bacterium]
MTSLLRTFLLLVGVIGMTSAASAQSGKIAGTITDAATGETIPGANVRIDGTTQGASTNFDGEYVIIGVRPDVYTLVVSYIGYQSQNIENVRVRIDLTTTVDVALQEESFGGEEITVQANRELFQKDVTATTATVSGDEIRELPVENFDQVVSLQAGVVGSGDNLHFRGGRSGEVGYLVDGVPVGDVYDGGLALEIENESVQELQVVTGAFNAEYGQALSGIVNVVTRDGSNDFEGGLEVWGGDYASSESGAPAIGTQEALLFPGTGTSDLDPVSVRNLEGTLSGPILRDRLFFFASGRYFGNDGWIYGRNVFTRNSVGLSPIGQLTLLDPEDVAEGGPAIRGDSSLVSLNPYEKISGQAKLTFNIGNGLRLSGNFLASQEDFRGANFDYYYLPEASRQNTRFARTSLLKFTHLLSNTTFYEIGLTNNFSRFENYVYEDPLDERYVDTRFLGFREGQLFSGFTIGGTDNGRFRRTTDTWLAKADLSSQVHSAHLVKTGIEARLHNLTFLDQFTFVQEGATFDVGNGPQNGIVFNNADYEYAPVELAAYIQDKVEVGGLIINAGLRFDYFDSNGRVLRDPSDPFALFEGLRRCQEVVNNECTTDAEGNPLLLDDPITPERHFEDASATWQVSPRLGVAFPISATGVVHFSYGQFFQVPNFELLYQNPYFRLGSGGSGLIGLFGNANLKPEQTINGEIGIKQELSGTSAVELTAYYRDIRNLAGTATEPIVIRGTGARYGQIINSDFGFVRGIILRFDQRIGRTLFGGFDYTFQVARANSSDPDQAYNAAAARQGVELLIVPTNWDQRHTVNASLTYADPDLDAGFGLLASYGSGRPYTPARTSVVTGGVVPPSVVPINSEIRPSTFNVNLNAYKNLQVGPARVQVFSRVDNLFDARNENGIYGDTGRATYSLEQAIEARNFRGPDAVLEQRYTRPDFFSQPRRVVLGLRVNV